ncbi:NAD(P)-dependent oxidoreductase [Blastococcus xanthinilyticus]|uniref:NAD(P)-binding domain-containing protein n=1 Tax=Blastococcus xanthinilyticus TaxID=1564164 RepID=A0A5S5D3I8_9ACTN|nr:NAD(P)H-binding protein [Blastococcus xanthinilyticus]TYP90521.1 hypothetical protein BD833_101239 [Blastococcus xanthinilyticus]
MDITVLAASGPTGRQLTTQALDRGHRVLALVRNPGAVEDLRRRGAEVAELDVTANGAAGTLGRLATGSDALVSGLGTARGGRPGILAAGAGVVSGNGTALVVPRTVWLSALGSGRSRGAAGPVWSTAMKLMLRSELTDKEAADELVLPAGAVSVHAPILKDGEASGTARTVPVAAYRGGVLPGRISRADVAAVMLDLATGDGHAGEVVVAAAR